MEIERRALETMILQALREIPAIFRDHIQNLAIALEEQPTREQLQSLSLSPGEILVGLYEGVPLTARGGDVNALLPDKITFFRHSLQELCRNQDELKRAVTKVVRHEIGHYFGLGEETLRRLEGRLPLTLNQRNRS